MPKLLIERDGAVTLFTLNRPEVHNNVDADLAVELAEGIMAFRDDDDAKVLVVTGAGDSTFCAGANLKGMTELFEHPYTYTAGPMGFALLDPGKPTIAAVNGWCLAGGVELACWCDFRIVAENARIGLLNKRWGLSLADGGTQRLSRAGRPPSRGSACRWPTPSRSKSSSATRPAAPPRSSPACRASWAGAAPSRPGPVTRRRSSAVKRLSAG